MVLFVTTFSAKPGDEVFFEQLEARLSPELVVYWGRVCPGSNEWLRLPLPWPLSLLPPASKRQAIADAFNAVDLGKQEVRLKLLPHQKQGDLSPSQAVLNHAEVTALVLKALRPRLVVATNPLVPHTAVPYEMAKAMGIRTLTVERGPIPGTMWFDEGGYGGWSVHAGRSLEEMFDVSEHSVLEKVGGTCLNEDGRIFNARGATASAEIDHGGEGQFSLPDSQGPRVLVIGAADINNAIFPVEHEDHQVNSPCFEHSGDLAKQVRRSIGGEVVFRPHPNCLHMVDRAGFEEGGITLGTGSLTDLLKWADVVVTNGSSVEYQALAMEKPLILGGRTVLTGKNIAYEINHPGEIRKAISSALAGSDQQARQGRFRILLGGLVRDHLVDPCRGFWPPGALKLLGQQATTAASRLAQAARVGLLRLRWPARRRLEMMKAVVRGARR